MRLSARVNRLYEQRVERWRYEWEVFYTRTDHLYSDEVLNRVRFDRLEPYELDRAVVTQGLMPGFAWGSVDLPGLLAFALSLPAFPDLDQEPDLSVTVASLKRGKPPELPGGFESALLEYMREQEGVAGDMAAVLLLTLARVQAVRIYTQDTPTDSL